MVVEVEGEQGTGKANVGIAQRARNNKRVNAIHSKIKNRRSDTLLKYSRKLVNEIALNISRVLPMVTP
jgi:hypothetical protein